MQSPESNIQVIETYVVMKQLPAANEIPVFDVDGKLISSGVTVGGGSFYLFGSLIGEANSTTGMFVKAAENVYSNPTGRPLSSPYAPGGGFQNGDVSPYRMPRAGTISKLSITFEGAAVGTGVKGATVYGRFRIYKMLGSSRVQIAEVDIALSDLTNVGIWNIAVAAGDLIGWEFVNVSADDYVNAFRVVESVLTVD